MVITEHRKIKLKLSQKLLLGWLGFMVMEGVMQVVMGGKSSTVLLNPLCCTTNLYDKKCPLVHQWHGYYRGYQSLSDQIRGLIYWKEPMPGTVNLIKNPWPGKLQNLVGRYYSYFVKWTCTYQTTCFLRLVLFSALVRKVFLQWVAVIVQIH